jgi:hypothetical protein
MLYSRKTTSEVRSPSPRLVPLTSWSMKGTAGEPRTTADDWTEEGNRQAAALGGGATAPADAGLFTEFRRKLAMGEALSRAVAKLAEALRFSGRITVSFHQGRITKTIFEELHIRSSRATGTLP